jgi:hypothetical protein
MNGFLVGVSENGGKTWTFAEGKESTPEGIRKMVPDFPDDLKLPKLKPPVLEKTE